VGERDAVADGNHDRVGAVVGSDVVVERADRFGVGVVSGGVYGITARDKILFENYAQAGSTTDTVNVRTIEVVLQETTRVASRPTALS
jgi:hypothetical protein